MKLAKALKVKNRMAGDIQKMMKTASEHNSHLKDNEPEFDVREIWNQVIKSIDEFVILKANISKANSEIYESIFRISELKGLIVFLGSINTQHGADEASYRFGSDSDHVIRHVATFREKEVSEMIVILQSEIDGLQDRIDEYNHVTMI